MIRKYSGMIYRYAAETAVIRTLIVGASPGWNVFSEHKLTGDLAKATLSFCKNEDSEYILTVSDDGAGFPKDIDFADTLSLGPSLVSMLTKQLGGSIRMTGLTKGMEFRISFAAD